jgi:hypothetical protein
MSERRTAQQVSESTASGEPLNQRVKQLGRPVEGLGSFQPRGEATLPSQQPHRRRNAGVIAARSRRAGASDSLSD